MAETLPDIKDDGVETALIPDATNEPVDAYALALTSSGMTSIQVGALKSLGRVKKSRKRKLGVALNPARLPENSGREVRFLPPGSMKDQWEQFRSLDPVGHNCSFKTFWHCWRSEFDFLRFRPISSHVQCSSCVRFKLMLKHLAGYPVAHKRQQQLYYDHLLDQYLDRQCYWTLRASARLRCSGHLVLILDGMDQCKFSYPRSTVTSAKELSTLMKPKLHIVGALLHGFMMFFALSNHLYPKDSSVMNEIIGFLLTQVGKKVRLQDHHVHVVADNTSRETKNSTTLRMLAALTSHRLVQGATLHNLRSGHSHEDIDQTFGSAALFLVRHARRVETPDQFVSVMQKFCATAHRPFEPDRLVVKLDQHRDWIFGVDFGYIFDFLLGLPESEVIVRIRNKILITCVFIIRCCSKFPRPGPSDFFGRMTCMSII